MKSVPFALVLAAMAGAGHAAAPSVATVYLCDGGALLRVAYLNAGSGESFAVVDWGGRLIPMEIAPAASGARYVAVDPEDGHSWHSRGEEGMLAHRSAVDDPDSETVLLAGCQRVG